MRRLLLTAAVAVLAIGLLAGCGSSSSGSSNPVSTELSYFPSSSPFVLSIATDPNSSAVKGGQALAARFPITTLGKAALTSRLQQLGLNYDSDIRPLFGSPVMIGSTGTTLSGSQSQNYLIVWVTKDAGKLSSLVKKGFPGGSTGSHGGAKLYGSGGAAAAIDGSTLVFGPSTAAVNAALDRHSQSSGFSQSSYSRLFTGLPQGGLLQTFGNLTSVLSQPTTAKARRVPWVAAFRGYAASISASSSGLTFSYRLDTTGAQLTAAQVPLATGTAAPKLAGLLPIAAGIENPAHIAQFAESAEQAASPAGYAKFLTREAAVRKRTGADLNSLIKLLTGNLIVSSDTHVTMARADVSNPSSAASILSKLVSAPRLVFSKATSVSKLGGGFYGINEPGQSVTVGVVGNQLVAGKASPAQLRGFASTATTPAPGAQGSMAFRVGLLALLRIGLKQAPPQLAQSILSRLGDITGWTSASPSGINGSATLAIH
jgi:hypothetical protein